MASDVDRCCTRFGRVAARIDACARLVVCLVLTAFLSACRTDICELDRTGAPVRFADIRETAVWTTGFDTAWWTPIDRAYEAYDGEVERLMRGGWEPFVASLRACEQTGFPKEPRAARAMWATHVRVRRELSDAEAAFFAALDDTLPPEADRFIELLRARAAFWRASAVWADHGKRVPGPLEVLTLTGLPAADAEMARAATDAYVRLSAVAARAAEERFDAYIEFCEEMGGASQEIAVLRAALPPESVAGDPAEKVRAREEAEQALASAEAAAAAIEQRLNSVARREADEKFRLALLRENRAFAAAIADPERQLDFLDRVDAFLHIGVRSHQSLRAVRNVALRVIELNAAELDAEKVAERMARVEKAYEDYFVAEKPLRARLASGSVKERAKAYRALVELVGPLSRAIAEATGVEGEVLELVSIGVSAGRDSAGDAAHAALEATARVEPEPEPPSEDDALISARSRELALLGGMALSPQVFAALTSELSLNAEQSEFFGRLRGEEIQRLAERSSALMREVRETTDSIARDMSLDAGARARGIMREGRRKFDAMRALDSAANTRMLSAIATIARVDLEDPRIARAALELELLSRIGASGQSNAGESIAGAVADGLANPFEIIRTMRVAPEDRDAALAIAFGFAEELRAAHGEAAERMQRNVETMLARIFAIRLAETAPEDAWYAKPCAGRAVDARRAIATEIGRVLGADVERAFHERWREFAQPGMTPPRTGHLVSLERFAQGVHMAGSERERTAMLRTEVDAVLLLAVDHRERALRALHVWRTGTAGLGDVRDAADWDSIARFAAMGSLLRSRVRDVDERAIARCEALLVSDAATPRSKSATEALAAIRRPPLELPVRLAPYFPGE